MRSHKPAASSSDACCRCTALLPRDAARCALCGWPAGHGYPPADPPPAPAATAPPPESEVAARPDDTQLDSLAGMAQRQQPEAPAPDASAPEAPAPEAPAPDEPAQREPAAEFDPLTAPLAQVVDSIEPTEEPSSRAVAPTTAETSTPRRTFDVQRLAQVFIMGAALTNLALVGLEVVAAGTTAVLALALVSLATWTAAAVTFLHWVSRSYTAVASSSPVRQRHGATMAVAGWLIPVAGIIIGYRVLQDLWTGADPKTRDDADAAPAKARLIDIWLLGLLTATVFGYAMPLALGDSALWSALSTVGVLVAAVALIQVMTTIGTWIAAGPIAASDEPPLSASAADGAGATTDEGTVSTRVDDLVAVPVEPVSHDDPVSVD